MAQLGKPTDEPAVKRIREAFPNCEVYPIKYAQTLTRLGGGLHCATWNTIEHGYQNAKYFKPSKRHPFNPFDEVAFTEKRLRAVIEHDLKRKLEDDEWCAFNIAFGHYWNSRWDNDSDFSAGDMYDSILRNLKEQNRQYFSTEKELVQVIDILITYLMHVPKLILPNNTEWDPREEYIPAKMLNVHFKDTVAQLTSFNVLFAHQTMEGNSELEFTAKVEKEAAEAAGRKDGTVYILYYRSCDKRRVCPYRYTLTARVGWTKHIRVIMYWDAPTIDLTIADYARIAFTDINFFKNCILYEKVGLPF